MTSESIENSLMQGLYVHVVQTLLPIMIIFLILKVSKDAPIQDFTDIPITDIIWPIKADTDNQSDIFQYD